MLWAQTPHLPAVQIFSLHWGANQMKAGFKGSESRSLIGLFQPIWWAESLNHGPAYNKLYIFLLNWLLFACSLSKLYYSMSRDIIKSVNGNVCHLYSKFLEPPEFRFVLVTWWDCIFHSWFDFQPGLKVESPTNWLHLGASVSFPAGVICTELGSYLFRCGDRHPVRAKQKRKIIGHIHPTGTGLLGDRKK